MSIPLVSVGLEGATRARFGALGKNGLLSGIEDGAGCRSPAEHEVAGVELDPARAPMQLGLDATLLAMRLRDSLTAASVSLTMRFDLILQWPWRFLAYRGTAESLR